MFKIESEFAEQQIYQFRLHPRGHFLVEFLLFNNNVEVELEGFLALS